MILDFPSYQALKAHLRELGVHDVHLNDCCGGQCFYVDDPDDATVEAIRAYFAERGILADFTDDRSIFMLLDKGEQK